MCKGSGTAGKKHIGKCRRKRMVGQRAGGGLWRLELQAGHTPRRASKATPQTSVFMPRAMGTH